MPTWQVLVLAAGLSMDAVAVSLAAGASRRVRDARGMFRLSFHFGLFQALMPVAGWSLGVSVAPYIESFDHWLAFALLGLVGVRMIRAAITGGGEDLGRDPSRGATLLLLSVATSIDALAIGLTLAMLGGDIWFASVVIGLVTATLSLLAILLGTRVGRSIGARMEAVGGVALLGIGVKILADHLW
jgi:putative Mn2+ efflux pump MntP